MSAHLPELVVFDMAGTTIEASDAVPEAFRDAFLTEGILLSDEEICSVRGRAKQDAIHELLKQHAGDTAASRRAGAVYATFRDLLLQVFRKNGVSTIGGVEETFTWLSSRGIGIALTTGFDRELAELLLELAGWRELPDALVSSDDVQHGRPAPDMVFEAMARASVDDAATVAVVGDTVSDLEAARAAGAGWSFGVLSGAHGTERLWQVPHTAIIESVRELPACFEN